MGCCRLRQVCIAGRNGEAPETCSRRPRGHLVSHGLWDQLQQDREQGAQEAFTVRLREFGAGEQLSPFKTVTESEGTDPRLLSSQ